MNNSLSDLVFKQIDPPAVLLLKINQNLLLTKFDILNSSQNSCFMRILSFTFSSFVTSLHLACASFMSPKSSLWNTVEAILLLKAYFKKKVLEGRRPYSQLGRQTFKRSSSLTLLRKSYILVQFFNRKFGIMRNFQLFYIRIFDCFLFSSQYLLDKTFRLSVGITHIAFPVGRKEELHVFCEPAVNVLF